MLRFKIRDLMGKKEFAEGRHVSIKEVAEGTGIHRMTLSKMLNQRGYNTGSENIDRLCVYFNCQTGDLIEYIPNNNLDEGA